MVYLALTLAPLVLKFYLGGKWVVPCLSIAAMHWLMIRRGSEGGLLDLMKTSRPLWLAATAILVMIFIGPIA